ncbi:hypothetical protein [Nonomuraea zeae]|uniref:Cytochrome P450 n=1 Tax=Nonomuraea zeae TaxID=1642303 RepID=A0A5S4FB59_9ACTN|nr:hypothetical protein [Nonomuraea zeae]TMR13943.1 hypothetical protein ETD85_57195 [Nonomuraea zeae]
MAARFRKITSGHFFRCPDPADMVKILPFHGERATMIESMFDQEYLRDPHAVFARLRAERPVFRPATPQGVRVWVVSRQ